jgi:DNA (cytosine-5)-methyltransferase 1
MQPGLCPTIPARAREDGSGQPIISYQRCFSNQYSERTEETGTLQASRIDKVPMVQINSIPDEYKSSPTIKSKGQIEYEKAAIPVLSPDRVEKRQNGRRFKENGEPSFTLTAQDRHGVLISDSGQGRKREVRDIAPPLRAHDGCGHDNYCIVENQRNELRKMEISPTLQASSSGKIGQSPPVVNFQDSIIRRLTPKECERLQDYPDDWTKYGTDEIGNHVNKISDTQRYKTCGNSITVEPAKQIMDAIYKSF